jgi:hypothetical protein
VSRPVRCRRCGALFLLDRVDLVEWGRLWPRCLRALLPTGGVAVSGDPWGRPGGLVPEAA